MKTVKRPQPEYVKGNKLLFICTDNFSQRVKQKKSGFHEQRAHENTLVTFHLSQL